ncbi:hypothetical protein GQX73_g5783 [Xylaria multiplex]|uniref:Letm1 RBD domain-containing protein n=1 Tax=Xylaria multiplex TaxID=323545 RepID=A0A7C8ITS9_9PEZI|nr:hypothetical protein GQX73_g5783 [Xylaria multiplex]
MSLNTGARFVRVQPILQHGIRHRASLRLSHSPSRIYAPSHITSLGFLYRNNAIQTQSRPASTSSPPQSKPVSIPSSTPASDTSSAKPPSEPEPFSDSLNPPASTRPPPLDLPVREPSTNLFTHLFRLGKAYTTFYKTGVKAVFTNRRLLRDLPLTGGSSSKATIATTDKSANITRASLLLRARVRHDTSRLPLFALIMLICGEFTPLIVIIFPRLTPYTCRIPSQTAVIRRSVESRRAASFRALSHATALEAAADGHICRSLGIGSPLWDRMGFDTPFAKSRAQETVGRIVQDDAMLRSGGGVRALVDDEVVLACEERGIDTLGKDIADLRGKLSAWVAKSEPKGAVDVEAMVKEATGKVRGLLLGLNGPI